MARVSDVAGRLHSVAIRVLRHAREADRETGLGPGRLSALSVLVFGGPRSVSDLASAEQVTVPTMTRIVQALEQLGFVRRKASPTDARSSIVAATPKGNALLRRARQARLHRIEALLKKARPEDVTHLGDALAAVFD